MFGNDQKVYKAIGIKNTLVQLGNSSKLQERTDKNGSVINMNISADAGNLSTHDFHNFLEQNLKFTDTNVRIRNVDNELQTMKIDRANLKSKLKKLKRVYKRAQK